MAHTKRRKPARASKSQKMCLSSDCRLQPACMKPESLVIAGQHTAVNVFLSLVHTARQATKVGGAQQRCRNPQGSGETGAAWLSSARVVRCWVKSRNERNPCELLPRNREVPALCSDCPALTGRKVGTTSSQYGPYGQGCTRTTMPSTEGS